MNKYLFLILLAQLLVVHASQKLSEYLWEQTTEYQQQALNSNLVYGMREKCLDPSEFGGYMVDDTVYLYYGSESLKRAGERSDDNATLQDYMEEEAVKWNGWWEWLNEIWHIKDAEGIRLGEAASTYIDHIKNVSKEEIPVYTILALTPCAKLWPWIGKQIGSGTKDFGLYTSWVEANFDPKSTGYQEYQDYVEWAYEAGTVTKEKALEIFTASIQSEVKFFNSVKRCQPSQHADSGDYQEYSDAVLPKISAVLLVGLLAVFVI